MDRDRLKGRWSDPELPDLLPPQENIQEPVAIPEKEKGPDVHLSYHCPLFWSPSVKCPWVGLECAMYDHFVLESESHGNDVVDVRKINAETHCQWTNYVQSCDSGGEENGFYRLLYWTHEDMLFFLSAKTHNDGMTGIHVIYIGQAKKANNYSCKISVENHGEEAAAQIILTLACGPTNGTTDIITIDQEVGMMIKNDVLKIYCAENGSLHFLVELQKTQVSEDEISDEPLIVDDGFVMFV